ncbi:hypothetical protein AB1Y20_001894 [Prymnesium parvum]|uniref:dihydroneopterin aldolase n=1 Tax=Prymnesium parvum TaxID=97485 RepID=A0AB34J7V9_PRYPA
MRAFSRALCRAPSDRILLKGLQFHGYHGALPEERAIGQKFRVDVELHTDLRAAGRSDDLKDTVNYVSVFELIRSHMEGSPKALLEAVAHDLILDILQEHKSVETARVRICKPQVSIPGILEHVAVDIVRNRKEVDVVT